MTIEVLLSNDKQGYYVHPAKKAVLGMKLNSYRGMLMSWAKFGGARAALDKLMDNHDWF